MSNLMSNRFSKESCENIDFYEVLRILDAYDKTRFKFMEHFLRVSFKYKENPFKYEQEKTEQLKSNMLTEQVKPNKKEDKLNLILEFCKEPKSVRKIM